MPAQLLPFLLAVTAITIIPGPDMALGLRNSLRGGTSAMWWTGLGCCTGLLGHAALSVVGLSAVLMAFQGTIKRWLGQPEEGGPDRLWTLTAGIFLASVYGGYFGGARSVILIALLVLAVNDSMRRLNALKSWLGLIGSAVTFVVYAIIAPVDWAAVLMLVPTTVLGGFFGGKLAQRLPAALLRYVVVAIAAAVALYMAFFD